MRLLLTTAIFLAATIPATANVTAVVASQPNSPVQISSCNAEKRNAYVDPGIFSLSSPSPAISMLDVQSGQTMDLAWSAGSQVFTPSYFRPAAINASFTFKNVSPKTATGVLFGFTATDKTNHPVKSRMDFVEGKYSPNILIVPWSFGISVPRIDQVASVTCSVLSVRFADGTQWKPVP